MVSFTSATATHNTIGRVSVSSSIAGPRPSGGGKALTGFLLSPMTERREARAGVFAVQLFFRSAVQLLRGKAAMAIPTGNNGVAWLRLTDKDGEIDLHNRWKGCGDDGVINPVVKYDESLRINAGYVLCQPRTPGYSWLVITDFSTKQVAQEGLVTTNTCGRATDVAEPWRSDPLC